MTHMITMNRVRALAKVLLGATLGMMLVAPSARAQGRNAVIVGTVMSELGRPVEAANVYINDMSISVGTDAAGRYRINIPAARVAGQQTNLRVRAIGHQPAIKPIRITADSQVVN